jgi:hypothetical protein
MGLVLADVGADMILSAVFNNSWPAGGKNLTLKLFTNDKTPADTDVAGDYTEASGGGYSAKTLANGSWTVTPGNDPSDAVYAEQIWTFTGALSTNPTIYGCFIIDADGIITWAERFTYPFTPVNNGDQLKLVPRFQLSKGTPS